MAVESNGAYSLDLTDLTEPVKVKIGETIYTLPSDIPLPLAKRLATMFTGIGKEFESEEEGSNMLAQSDELWALTEEVMSRATPTPNEKASVLLTTQAAIKLLTFLSTRFNGSLTIQAP